MSLSKKTLEHPVLILIVFALLGMLGIFTLSNVAIALMPEIENPSLSISTSYPNAGPESVEKYITKLIESAVMSVNGLKNMTSTSLKSFLFSMPSSVFKSGRTSASFGSIFLISGYTLSMLPHLEVANTHFMFFYLSITKCFGKPFSNTFTSSP